MSENLYDLTDYPNFAPAGKPYQCIDPQSEEEYNQLCEYLDVETHRSNCIKELKVKEQPKNSIKRFAKVIPIGETLTGEQVLIIIQGAISNKEFHGGWFAVVCDPLGLDELFADLEEEERKVKGHLEHTASGGADGRN